MAENTDLMHWLDEQPDAHCTVCNRATWGLENVGQACLMTQPDGSQCRGVFEATS